MKILIVMRGYFPGKEYGGPPVSVENFCKMMSNYEIYIVTHNHDLTSSNAFESVHSGWNVRSECRVLYLSDEQYGYRQFKEIMEDIKPDLIYLQSFFENCVLPCLILAKKNNIKVLLAPRGELCKGAFKKKYKKIPYIILLRLSHLVKNIYWQSTSEEETEDISQKINVRKNHIYFLTNIPSLDTDNETRYLFKKQGKARLIYLSRIVRKKNLDIVLKSLNHVKGEIQFDIYGTKEDICYWEECEKIINNLPDNISVCYQGIINHDEVSGTFKRYDAFVFPTSSENYGHVIAEALLAGCPVIISDRTPWNEIEQENAGWIICLDNESDILFQLKERIQMVVDSSDENWMAKRRQVLAYINNKLKINKIRDEYESTLSNICER